MKIIRYDLELGENLIPRLTVAQEDEYKDENVNSDARLRLERKEDVADMLNALYGLNKKAEEHSYLVGLDIDLAPLAVFEVSHGDEFNSPCVVRGTMKRLLLCGALKFTVCHNHPCGGVEPSEDDIRVGRTLKRAGSHLGIELYDSVIVDPSGGVFSLAENGLV